VFAPASLSSLVFFVAKTTRVGLSLTLKYGIVWKGLTGTNTLAYFWLFIGDEEKKVLQHRLQNVDDDYYDDDGNGAETDSDSSDLELEDLGLSAEAIERALVSN
jgi:hypothetical protein